MGPSQGRSSNSRPHGIFYLPIVVLNFGPSASLGTGIIISTLFAVDRRLN